MDAKRFKIPWSLITAVWLQKDDISNFQIKYYRSSYASEINVFKL